MKWTCHKFQRWLIESLDGSLSERKQRALAAHLRQCRECRQFQKNLADSLSLLQSEWEMAVPEGAKLTVSARVQASLKQISFSGQRTLPGRLHSGWLPRLALSAVTVIFLFFLARAVSRKSTQAIFPKKIPQAVVVESARYRGEPANLFVFESPNQKTTFIWID